MRKLLPVLLIILVSTGAFAQFKMNMYADFFPEMMRYTVPLNDFANINLADMNHDNGLYRGAGTFDFLSSSSEGAIGLQNELRINLNYTGRNMSAYIQLAADEHIRPGGGFMYDDTMTVSYAVLLNETFREWYLQGKIDMFTIYAGRTDDFGKVDHFQDSVDDFLDALRISSFGLITPRVGFFDYMILETNYTRMGLSFNHIEGNNLLPKLYLTDEFGFVNQAYFSVAAFFEPFTVQIAGDLGNTSGITPEIGGNRQQWQSYNRLNGALRISGERIAQYFTFDAVYKIRGGDPDTRDPQPDGKGVTVHNFGLYANIFDVPSFNFGIGYTGLFRKYEDRDRNFTSAQDPWRERNSPFFSGVDLRVQYTGFRQFTISNNNNISFAVAKGNSDNRIQTISVTGMRPLLTTESESWLALYNTLSINYEMNPRMIIALQCVNMYCKYSIENKAGSGTTETVSTNTFGITPFVVYRFNESIMVQGGIQFLHDTYKYQRVPETNNINGNMVYVAVPLRFRINF
ncbi:MAG: hypothetical protein LBC80_02915 [Treponema sp.]|jgi:hypothetical protein|nr:hypothetical protein [Treponema sp.]